MNSIPKTQLSQPEEVTIDEQRRREIEQGLRELSGTLIGSPDVGGYGNGIDDFGAGWPPPSITSTSYDLGRARASQKFEQAADLRREIEGIEQEAAENHRKTREMLAGWPEALEAYNAAVEETNGPTKRIGHQASPKPTLSVEEIEQETAENHRKTREMLAGWPEALEAYNAAVEETNGPTKRIEQQAPPKPTLSKGERAIRRPRKKT